MQPASAQCLVLAKLYRIYVILLALTEQIARKSLERVSCRENLQQVLLQPWHQTVFTVYRLIDLCICCPRWLAVLASLNGEVPHVICHAEDVQIPGDDEITPAWESTRER
jgi:hypothetical protein